MSKSTMEANQMPLAEVAVDCEIQGTAPLLMSAIGPKAKAKMKGDGERKVRSRANEESEWRDKLYQEEGGQIYAPARWVERALVGAAKEFKRGRGLKTYEKLFEAAVFVEGRMSDDPSHLLMGKKEPDYIDEQSAVNRATKGRIWVNRPAFQKGWRLTFRIRIEDPEAISAEVVNKVLVHAGRFCGLGSYRPRYGRFIVTNFQTASPVA